MKIVKKLSNIYRKKGFNIEENLEKNKRAFYSAYSAKSFEDL